MKQKEPFPYLPESIYQLFEKSQDVIYVRHGHDYSLAYINLAFEKLWGVKRERIYQDYEALLSQIHPDDRTTYAKESKQFYQQLQPEFAEFQYRIHPMHYIERRIKETVIPLFDKSNPIAFLGLIHDLTFSKTQKAEFEQAAYFFQFFTEKFRSVFWIRNEDFNKQIYLSPGYKKVWGRELNELYDHPEAWFETVHPDDRDRVSYMSRLRALKNEGPDVEYEFRYRILMPDQSVRWIKDTSFPIYDNQTKFIGYAGFAEDITKEVLYAEELTQAKQRAEVANQAKSDFLAMFSHELRTPLNAILGMAQIMQLKGLSPEFTEYVNHISQAGRHLLVLVNDILDFARIEAGKLSFCVEPFNLNEMLTQLIQSLEYQAEEKKLSLVLKNDVPDKKIMLGDPNRLRQVLVNLLSNAIKFTQEGTVTLKVSRLQQDHDRYLIRFAVTDTGIGLTKAQMAIIFEKFSQVDSIYHRKQGGIGLGLAIAKELVNAMGGDIQVKSEYQQGSTFYFNLWLKVQYDSKALHKTELINHHETEKRHFPYKILLVEDNLINQKIAKIMLEEFGCQLTIMADGDEVMKQIKNLAQYDLIFMDIGLPDMSGFDIVKRLRKEEFLKKKPIIAMTAHILDEDRKRAFKAGMDKIIAKPISYDILAEILSHYQEIILERVTS